MRITLVYEILFLSENGGIQILGLRKILKISNCIFV